MDSSNKNLLSQKTNAHLSTSIDPRLFRLPPPPPPAPPVVSYSATMAMPQNQYILNPYCVPPPPVSGTVMTGQYTTITYQQEIYHPHQYQRLHTSKFFNTGGHYNQNFKKRKVPQEEPEITKKIPRKKKKPLSQNIPFRRDWSVEDARKALEVEKEFNQRHKNLSVIIKFPDLELNRDIVSKFHPEISSVHFQQPSTPRFCFVTLKDCCDMEEVIKEINKIKFGDGYLTAEPKKDREKDLNIGPEDIDPLTLYVGNLAQEVTVDDVVKAYPNNKRIDIGFAKKMKYTRYAFISFRTVDDAIRAFQNTHSTEMYNKSLIVRFRRLHGTVGLPGEPKPQNHPRSEGTSNSDNLKDNSISNDCSLPVKEEPPDNPYNYDSDDDEDDEEEHQYSNDIRNLVMNSLGVEAANVKIELLEFDKHNYFGTYESNNSRQPINDSHVPLLEPKTEEDVKPPIIIKDENEDWAEEDSKPKLEKMSPNVHI